MRAGNYAGFVARMNPAAQLVKVTPLAGGMSATVVRVEVANADPPVFVIRSHGAVDRARNPNIARDEFHLLERLADAGLPVPRPLHLDAGHGEDEIAAFALTWIEGAPRFDDLGDDEWRTLAETLASIHQASIETRNLAFAPPRAPIDRPPRTPDEAIWESRSRRALSSTSPAASNRPCVLHGDYWLGNVLWSDDTISAVVDWEDFAFGDPLADLGSARLELRWARGSDAMQAFTEAYFDAHPIDRTDLAYWDIAATLHFSHRLDSIANDADDLARLRDETCTFLADAYERLPGR